MLPLICKAASSETVDTAACKAHHCTETPWCRPRGKRNRVSDGGKKKKKVNHPLLIPLQPKLQPEKLLKKSLYFWHCAIKMHLYEHNSALLQQVHDYPDKSVCVCCCCCVCIVPNNAPQLFWKSVGSSGLWGLTALIWKSQGNGEVDAQKQFSVIWRIRISHSWESTSEDIHPRTWGCKHTASLNTTY